MCSSVPIFALTCAFFFRFAVCAAVTGHAVIKVPYTFFQVFGSDPVWLVFMTVVAGVFAVIVAGVAGRATGVVAAVQQKQFGMVKLCGFLFG